MSVYTFEIPAGKIATFTAGATAATLTRLANSPGASTEYSPVEVAAATAATALGPFAENRRYQYESDNEGSVAYTVADLATAAADALTLSKAVDDTLADGVDIALGTSTGSKIGTATDQKLAFHNSTPVIQRASANQTAVTDSTGGSVADAIAAAVTTFTPSVAWDGAAVFPSAADATAIAAAITALTNGLAKTIELTNELRAALVEKGLIKGAA